MLFGSADWGYLRVDVFRWSSRETDLELGLQSYTLLITIFSRAQRAGIIETEIIMLFKSYLRELCKRTAFAVCVACYVITQDIVHRYYGAHTPPPPPLSLSLKQANIFILIYRLSLCCSLTLSSHNADWPVQPITSYRRIIVHKLTLSCLRTFHFTHRPFVCNFRVRPKT